MDFRFLSKINCPQDIKALSFRELSELCSEIRYRLIETVSRNGGHLASNLGAVEITVAMHKIFDSPKDQLIFDVGHQCYTHKLLTGRYDKFSSLRKKDGLSGFCRPMESEHDIFFSGHSGTSVSAGLGLAKAKEIKAEDGYVVSVIGDGSFTGGMVYEALNNGGRSAARQIIILNDNNMSISENVGSFAKYLAIIRSSPGYSSLKVGTEKIINKLTGSEKAVSSLNAIKNTFKNKIYVKSTFFEDLGYHYMGPIDGHNIELMCDALESAKTMGGPVVIHAITVKGRGYEYAEKDPSIYHGISRFDIYSGEARLAEPSFSDKFGEYLCSFAEKDSEICAITAAMSIGTGLVDFSEKFHDRFFDVGIAEEHAVTFASGLARNGLKPVFAVYSTFLQRCYDQIIHDVSLQKQKVIFAVDRAGFVGEDGETHHGLFDVAFLNTVPDIKIYSPCSFELLRADLSYGIYDNSGSTAIRYPRGTENVNVRKINYTSLEYGLYGSYEAENLIVTYGNLSALAVEAVDSLKEIGIDSMLLALNQIKPIPEDAIKTIKTKKRVFFFEEGQKSGGVAEKIGCILAESGFSGKYKISAVDNRFVQHAEIDELLKIYNLDSDSMIKIVSGE